MTPPASCTCPWCHQQVGTVPWLYGRLAMARHNRPDSTDHCPGSLYIKPGETTP